MSSPLKALDLMNYRRPPNCLSQISNSKVSITSSLGVYCYLLGTASSLARQPWPRTEVHTDRQWELSSAMHRVAERFMIKPVCNVLNVADVYTSQTLLF